MTKGTFSALSQLKPTDLKTGEAFGGFIDDMIKRGDAARAEAVKRAQEEGKSLSGLLKDLKVEHKTTISPLQEESNRIVTDAIEYIGNAKMMAENMNIPIEQRRKYAQQAMDYERDVKEMQSFMSDPEFVKQVSKNYQTISENKAFEGDSRIGLYTSVESGFWKMRRNENGRLEAGYIANINEPNPEIKWESFAEVKQKYMSPIEENTIPEYTKNLIDIAQKVTTETTNSNGYVETYSKKFDAKDARSLLMTSFGFDPAKTDADAYSVNSVPRQLNHLFYQKNKRSISSAEDFQAAINDSIEIMRTSADEKTSRKVLKTQADILEQQLDIRNKMNPRTSGGGSGSSKATVIQSAGEGIYNTQVKDARGNVVGRKEEYTSVMPIKAGLYAGFSKSYDPKTKQYYNSFKVGEVASNGEIVFSAPIRKEQFEVFLKSNKINPVVALSNLGGNVKTVNKWQPKVYETVKDTSKNPYTSLKIGTGSNNDTNSGDGTELIFNNIKTY